MTPNIQAHINQRADDMPRYSCDETTGALLDESGRRILLRGANMGGRCKWAPFAPGALGDSTSWGPLAEAMTQQLLDWGLNCIRLSLNWEAYEPQQGYRQAGYLANLKEVLDAAHERGQVVVLDFHQDIFAAPFGGNGFPQWTIPKAYRSDQRPSRRAWFLNYALNKKVQHCFDRFWRDTDNIQTAFFGMWTDVLRALGDHPALIGIDVFNEPSWGTTAHPSEFKHSTLLPFYERAHRELHPIAPHLLIGYGMPGVECTDIVPHHHVRPSGSHLLFTPHLYDPSILLTKHGGLTIPPERAIDAMGRFQRESATPVLIGEFGVTHGARDGHLWLERVYAAMDKHLIHGTIWELSHDSDLWNGEDLNLVDARNQPRPIVDAVARPYPSAVSAPTFEFKYSPRKQIATLSYKANSDQPTHVRVPTHITLTDITEDTETQQNATMTRWSMDTQRGVAIIDNTTSQTQKHTNTRRTLTLNFSRLAPAQANS